MSTATERAPAAQPGRIGFLKAAAVVIAVGAVTAHFMGYVAYRNFLAGFGIDEGLFPKTADWFVIQGVLAGGSALTRPVPTELLSEYWVWFALAALWTAAVFVAMWGRVRWLPQISKLRGLMPSAPQVQTAVALAVAPWVGVVVVLVARWLLLLGLAIPLVAAHFEGRRAAAVMLAQAQFGGCAAKGPAASRCVALVKDGQVLARGFIIDTSSRHVAILDVATRAARIIEHAGVEFRTE